MIPALWPPASRTHDVAGLDALRPGRSPAGAGRSPVAGGRGRGAGALWPAAPARMTVASSGGWRGRSRIAVDVDARQGPVTLAEVALTVRGVEGDLRRAGRQRRRAGSVEAAVGLNLIVEGEEAAAEVEDALRALRGGKLGRRCMVGAAGRGPLPVTCVFPVDVRVEPAGRWPPRARPAERSLALAGGGLHGFLSGVQQQAAEEAVVGPSRPRQPPVNGRRPRAFTPTGS
ncbi:hypothetical protein [Candidatus Amarobacter glycogenicus]|uniref:hypothetical protein n=1 Tax=Candidatus Amarobacter glycogenicus TaxID=3140699 RepID=UPI003135E601|nr:hypothetical protein [Dehalococcoidia bacterium]